MLAPSLYFYLSSVAGGLAQDTGTQSLLPLVFKTIYPSTDCNDQDVD